MITISRRDLTLTGSRCSVQSLQDKFLAFAAYGSKKSETQLDGRSYVKLFKDAGLLKKPLTTTDLVCFI
jgi:p25-alpha